MTIKPILYNIAAFDATLEKAITFTWSGNQAFKNTCIIRNNATNTIVYNQTQETLQLRHVVPPNILTNGTLYNVTIKVIDKDNTVSEESVPLLFYCFSTPILSITNLVEHQVVQNASFQITLKYSQAQSEELQYYQVLLYNMNKNQIWTSGVKYSTSNLETTLSGLDDNGTYYVRATGLTINGMEVDTGYIPFSVNYIMPSVYALVTLENKQKEGTIKIQSNIISLEGKSNVEPIYIGGEYVNLTNPNHRVEFDEGFSLANNFTINLKGYNFTDFSTILQLSNGEKVITLTKNKGVYKSENNVEKTYFELLVPSALSHYVIRSNFIDNPKSTDTLSIWIRRQNNIYDLYVKNLSTPT